MLFLGGGGCGHGTQWRAWRTPGERERRWRGLGVEDVYEQRRKREARCCLWGEGDADMGWRRRAWRGPGERERRDLGPAASWWRLGERQRRE